MKCEQTATNLTRAETMKLILNPPSKGLKCLSPSTDARKRNNGKKNPSPEKVLFSGLIHKARNILR